MSDNLTYKTVQGPWNKGGAGPGKVSLRQRTSPSMLAVGVYWPKQSRSDGLHDLAEVTQNTPHPRTESSGSGWWQKLRQTWRRHTGNHPKSYTNTDMIRCVVLRERGSWCPRRMGFKAWWPQSYEKKAIICPRWRLQALEKDDKGLEALMREGEVESLRTWMDTTPWSPQQQPPAHRALLPNRTQPPPYSLNIYSLYPFQASLGSVKRHHSTDPGLVIWRVHTAVE